MFHKLYSFVLLFLPKLYMSILAGCYNEIRSGKRKKNIFQNDYKQWKGLG